MPEFLATRPNDRCLNDAQIRPRKSHCDVDDSGSAGSASAVAAAAVAAANASGSTGAGAAAASAAGGAGKDGNSSTSATTAASAGGQMPRSNSAVSLKSRRSMPSQKSMSKNSVDEPMCISAELHDLPEGSESGDSETATEVEVSTARETKREIRFSVNENRIAFIMRIIYLVGVNDYVYDDVLRNLFSVNV